MNTDMERMTLPARIDCLEALRTFIRHGADGTGLPPEEIHKLDLVLEELFVNIARHAYGPEQGDVEIAYTVEAAGRLRVEISDRGRAFNPLESGTPDLDQGLAGRRLGGLGIFLVKAMAGSLHYRRQGDRNTISFVFPEGRGAGRA